MKTLPLLIVLLPVLLVAIAGCQNTPTPVAVASDPDAEVKVMLATLGADDQLRAEQQKYCPVMPDTRLGEMGPPQKVLLNGETMFLCCKNCVKIAQDDPARAVAQMRELREARERELTERTEK